MKKVFIFMVGVILVQSISASEYFYEYGKKVELIPSSDIRDMECCDGIYRYKTKDGREVVFKSEVLVKLKKDINPQLLFEEFGIEEFKKISKDTFLIILNDKNPITLAKELYESGKVVYATPNRLKKAKRR